jgi:hypothetical protein
VIPFQHGSLQVLGRVMAQETIWQFEIFTKSSMLGIQVRNVGVLWIGLVDSFTLHHNIPFPFHSFCDRFLYSELLRICILILKTTARNYPSPSTNEARQGPPPWLREEARIRRLQSARSTRCV